MGDLQISPEALRSSANGIVNVVDQLSSALTSLENALHGYGSPWGDGLLGSVMAQVYDEIHEMAMGVFEANGEVLSEYAEGLDTMADEWEATEEEIEGGLTSAQSEITTTFPGP